MTTRPAAQTASATATVEVNYYCLCTWKSALKLEKVGLKSSGGAIRPRIAERLGLKPRADRDVFIARIQELMNQILAQRADEVNKAANDSV